MSSELLVLGSRIVQDNLKTPFGQYLVYPHVLSRMINFMPYCVNMICVAFARLKGIHDSPSCLQINKTTASTKLNAELE